MQSKNKDELLKKATKIYSESKFKARKFERDNEGKLILNPNNKFDANWFKNDDAFDDLV